MPVLFKNASAMTDKERLRNSARHKVQCVINHKVQCVILNWVLEAGVKNATKDMGP